MINNRSKAVEVISLTETVNELNERIKTKTITATVDMAISLNSGNTQQVMNVLAAHSTHTGITRDEGITMGNQIKDGDDYYAIDYITKNRNLYILNLRLVESL